MSLSGFLLHASITKFHSDDTLEKNDYWIPQGGHFAGTSGADHKHMDQDLPYLKLFVIQQA